ncbi:MAG: hypothetical protein ACOX9C_08770 [Kiritimatiellia bacterium]
MTGFRGVSASMMKTANGGLRFSASVNKVRPGRPPDDGAPWVEVDSAGFFTHPSAELAEDAPRRSLWFNAAMLALLMNGGLLVHSAGAVLKRRGIVIAALSGTGKSTLSRFLEDAFPGSVVGDERMAVRPVPSPDADAPRWMLAGTPWESTAGIARKTTAPLAALVFLEQAPACEIESISALDAAKRLLPLISVDWTISTLADLGVSALNALLAAIPAYVFRLPKSPDAARFLATWVETLNEWR